jgi:hypothetical protein
LPERVRNGAAIGENIGRAGEEELPGRLVFVDRRLDCEQEIRSAALHLIDQSLRNADFYLRRMRKALSQNANSECEKCDSRMCIMRN